jgi:hypothetical protein
MSRMARPSQLDAGCSTDSCEGEVSVADVEWQVRRIGMHWLPLCVALVALLPGADPLHAQAQSEEGRRQALTQSPFSGTWVANVAKSKRHPNHLFRSASLRFAVTGEAVTLTHGGVNASGKEESGTVTLQVDGKEHPASPQAPGVIIVTRWVGSRILETVATKDGQTVGKQSYEVSADGDTLTASVWGTDASGARFDHVIVFDRN